MNDVMVSLGDGRLKEIAEAMRQNGFAYRTLCYRTASPTERFASDGLLRSSSALGVCYG